MNDTYYVYIFTVYCPPPLYVDGGVLVPTKTQFADRKLLF